MSPSAALAGEEQRYEDTVARFTEAELVLEDGTAFVIDTNTEIDGALAQSVDVNTITNPVLALGGQAPRFRGGRRDPSISGARRPHRH